MNSRGKDQGAVPDRPFVEPTCDKCGAPICTGLMAVFCPRADECEFWPTDEEGEGFVRELRANLPGAE